jgi:hypothetical protein
MNDQPMATLGALLTRAWAFYRANARLVLLVTLPVVAFVDLVIGAGLGELTASVHKKLPSSDIYIELAATEFVTVPLVTAMLARAIVIALRGDAPLRIGRVVEEGLDLFVPAFLAVLLFVSGVLVGSILILPALYLYVSWYFVVQAVAIDGLRGFQAVNTSSSLVRGRWWHSAGMGVGFWIVVAIPALLATGGFEELARGVNSDALVIVGNVLIDTLTLPFVVIGATLYYLDLRARAGMAGPR